MASGFKSVVGLQKCVLNVGLPTRNHIQGYVLRHRAHKQRNIY